MLVHIKQLFQGDVLGKFAYPAFNTMDLEITQGIIAAAEQANAGIILEVSEGAIKYAGLSTLYEIMATMAIKAKIPVALHMDHGKDVEQLKQGIELGFSSVMIDHSHLPYEANVKDTKAMVEFAHQEGAWVQGEVGRIRGSEDWVSVSESQALLTDPKEALKFYQDTGVDTLACSFGTIHGIIKMSGKAQAHVDVDRIKAVHELTDIPLVLHGASGVPADIIRQAIANGIGIINIDTEIRLAYSQALRQSLTDQPAEIDPRKIMKPVIEAVKHAAGIKLQEFKTQNLVA
jgi:fructose-bisphosphate aldolase, class II